MPASRTPATSPLALAIGHQLRGTDQGFSLLEMLLVIGGVSLFSAGSFVVYRHSANKADIRTEQSNIQAIADNADKIYGASGTYQGLTTSQAVARRVPPTSMIAGTGLVSRWSHPVLLEPTTIGTKTNAGLRITYQSVPQRACFQLAQASAVGMYDITVGGQSVFAHAPGGVPTKLDMAAALARCAPTSSSMVFTYYGGSTGLAGTVLPPVSLPSLNPPTAPPPSVPPSVPPPVAPPPPPSAPGCGAAPVTPASGSAPSGQTCSFIWNSVAAPTCWAPLALCTPTIAPPPTAPPPSVSPGTSPPITPPPGSSVCVVPSPSTRLCATAACTDGTDGSIDTIDNGTFACPAGQLISTPGTYRYAASAPRTRTQTVTRNETASCPDPFGARVWRASTTNAATYGPWNETYACAPMCVAPSPSTESRAGAPGTLTTPYSQSGPSQTTTYNYTQAGDPQSLATPYSQSAPSQATTYSYTQSGDPQSLTTPYTQPGDLQYAAGPSETRTISCPVDQTGSISQSRPTQRSRTTTESRTGTQTRSTTETRTRVGTQPMIQTRTGTQTRSTTETRTRVGTQPMVQTRVGTQTRSTTETRTTTYSCSTPIGPVTSTAGTWSAPGAPYGGWSTPAYSAWSAPQEYGSETYGAYSAWSAPGAPYGAYGSPVYTAWSAPQESGAETYGAYSAWSAPGAPYSAYGPSSYSPWSAPGAPYGAYGAPVPTGSWSTTSNTCTPITPVCTEANSFYLHGPASPTHFLSPWPAPGGVVSTSAQAKPCNASSEGVRAYFLLASAGGGMGSPTGGGYTAGFQCLSSQWRLVGVGNNAPALAWLYSSFSPPTIRPEWQWIQSQGNNGWVAPTSAPYSYSYTKYECPGA